MLPLEFVETEETYSIVIRSNRYFSYVAAILASLLLFQHAGLRSKTPNIPVVVPAIEPKISRPLILITSCEMELINKELGPSTLEVAVGTITRDSGPSNLVLFVLFLLRRLAALFLLFVITACKSVVIV